MVFKLRDYAKWHDGSKIKPEDVHFSYDILIKEGHPFYKLAFKGVQDVKVESESEISFVLNEISQDLIKKIALMPIISMKYYLKNPFNKITLKPFLGSGPYKISDVKPGKFIEYERVKDYWGKDLNVNRGRYNFDKIRYFYYRDVNIAIQALKAGDYDIRLENVAKNWAKQYSDEFLKESNFKKKIIEHSIPSGMQSFVFNTRLKKFSDIRVRKAIAMAFDYEWTNKNLFYGQYKRSLSYYTNSVYEASGELSSWESKVLSEIGVEDLSFYRDLVELPVNKEDGNNRAYLNEALDLLKEAGFEVRDFHLRDKDGNKFEIEFLITSPSFKRVILPYIRNLKKIGIEANIRLVDYSQFQKQLENFDFEMIVHVFPSVSVPGNEQLFLWHSDYAEMPGSRNIIGIKNPVIDNILERLVSSDNFKDKKRYTKLLDRVLRNNHYVVPHWHLNYFRIIHKDKLAFPDKSPDYGLALDSWWQDGWGQ